MMTIPIIVNPIANAAASAATTAATVATTHPNVPLPVLIVIVAAMLLAFAVVMLWS